MNLCDVTLREGEQMPGRDYPVDEQIEAGLELDRLGVPYIQAGFPATGETDRAVIRELSDATDARIVGLARAIPGDIDAALDAEADVIEVFVPVSKTLLDHLVGASRAEMLDRLADAVERVNDHGATAHVTLADAFRTEPATVADVIETLPETPIVNLADTVGIRTPHSVSSFLASLEETVALDDIGVHFHDDLGCATANALEAMARGVGRIDVSVSSLGERAGNTALEEVAVAGALDYDWQLVENEQLLAPVCRAVLEHLGEDLDGRKAVLGPEVHTHESGIHTAVMLDTPEAFEAYDPARFGADRRLLFGPKTGQGGAKKLLARADIDPDEETIHETLDLLSQHGPMSMDDAISLLRRHVDP